MPQLGQNLCNPARIFGPATQTLFCGCSVMSFTVTAGWNEQIASVTIELVQDTCYGPRIWWDETLQRQSDNIVDPGFTEPDQGVAAYFRVEEDPDGATEALRGGFEYAGLIESWNEKTDSNGNPVFTVKIADPRVILENTQVIVNDFPGTTSGVWNLINAYAYVEGLGTSCTSSPASAIGGVTLANSIGNSANDRGMVWNDVKCAIHTLTSAIDQSLAKLLYTEYCRDNRLVYVGPNASEEGYGIIEKDDSIGDMAFQTIPNANLNTQYYYVDLTELPFSPSYYRISGPNISLMEIISQVCQDAGCDYYVELQPVRSAGSIKKIIKVRVAVRSSQPQMGKLDEFIVARRADAADANGGILSSVKGEEVRNESTSIYLIGGKLLEPFESTAAQMLPFWGTDTDGNIIEATIVGNEYFVNLDLVRLNATLYNPFAAQFQTISESELRASLGDFDAWKYVTVLKGGDFATWMADNNHHEMFDLVRQKAVFEGLLPAIAAPKNVPPEKAGAVKFDDDINPSAESSKDIDAIYEFVRAYADQFYGKQFITNAPFVCFTTDAESGKKRYSHDPSTNGCWVTDGTATVLGLTHDSAASDFFRDDVGKYQAIIRFPLIGASTIGGDGGALVSDPSQLGDDNYITDGVDDIWVKADVNPQWLFGTPLDSSSSTISFVLSIAAPVVNRATSNDVTNDFFQAMAGFAAALEAGGQGAANVAKFMDQTSFILTSTNVAIAPTSSLCPRSNNVQVYGPWGVAGLPGQVTLETDEGFVPWEYGSDVIMNNAAIDKVTNAVTQMRKGERGSVTVAGFPNIPLCAELMAVDAASPPHSQGDQKYIGTRTLSASLCDSILPFNYCKMNAWTGEFGPNITSLNVQVGPGGFTTEYQFSTYTPQAGRFTKDNSERLKRIGQTRLSSMRNLRAQAALNNQIRGGNIRGRQRAESQKGRSNKAAQSPHHFLMGRYTLGGDPRPEVSLQNMSQARYSIPSGVYSGIAMSSLDAFFRPVSKSGDGGLSPFVAFNSNFCSDLPDKTRQSDPPINEYTHLSVTQLYIDPYANPNSSLPTNRSDTAGSGHDIEVLARGDRTTGSGWCIPEGEVAGTGGYSDDYRLMALRGPILIQQYGYDDEGKPVPNNADVEADTMNGVFTTGNLEDKFLPGWLQKPLTWPVAPLDLRLDRERGVWTVPQPPRPVHVTPTGTCLISASGANVNNGKTIYDANGTVVSTKTVNVEWPWTITPPTGVGKIPVYYDNVDCKHYAFPVNRLDVAAGSGYGAGFVATDTHQDIKRIIFDTVGPTVTGCDASPRRFLINSGIDPCSRDIYISITGIEEKIITFESSNESGSEFTVDEDCVSISGGRAYTCSDACGGVFDADGPYLTRKPAKYLDTLVAGFGLGITSCTDCDVIVFNNHRDVGIDNTCTGVDNLQVGQTTWSDNFAISEGDDGGGPVAGSTGSKDTKVELNTGGDAWSITYISSILCGTNGDGYITGIIPTCKTLSGNKSCASSPMFWIQATGVGGSCGGCL